MSIKEIEYKLLSKGIDRNALENYIANHQDELLEFEYNSAKNIIAKKQAIMQMEDIINYLRKKGYKSETLKEIEE